MLFLGIEVASDHVRALVLDLESKTVVASGREDFDSVKSLPDGHREQDACQWIRATDDAVRYCLAELGDERKNLGALSVSARGNGLVMLDAQNSLVRPAKLATDRSSAPQREALSRAFGGTPGWIEMCGSPLRTESLACKLLWSQENEPYNFSKIATVMQPVDFLNYWLTGVKKAERGLASRSSLLDLRRRRWCGDVLGFIGGDLARKLPPPGDGGSVGFLRPEVARTWGLEHEIRVASGGGEDMMRTLAAGVALVELGEAAHARTVPECLVIDEKGELFPSFYLKDRFLLSFEELQANQTLHGLFAHYSWNEQQLHEAVSEAEPGADGLLFLPAEHEGGSGLLHGLNGTNFSPRNVARATMEGLALSLDFGMARMRELEVGIGEIRVAGACADALVWCQMLADMTGCPVVAVKRENSAAFGAAMQAALCYLRENGGVLSHAELAAYLVGYDGSERCEPRDGRREFHEKQLARQRYLAESLTGTGFLV